MTRSNNTEKAAPLRLYAETAADLMTPNPVSIEADDTVKEAVAFLTDKGLSAAPVVNFAGRLVGVLSRSDIVVYDREKVEYVALASKYRENAGTHARSETVIPAGFGVVDVDRTRVREIMTPVVFSVGLGAPHTRLSTKC